MDERKRSRLEEAGVNVEDVLARFMNNEALASGTGVLDQFIGKSAADGTLRLTVKGVDVGSTVVEGHISALCLAPAE